MKKKHYIYGLTYPDGRVFYIGKGTVRKDGTRRRPYDHIYKALRGEKSHKANIIRKILRSGREVSHIILLETDNHQEAIDKEIELIAKYPNLSNITKGGEGILGYRHTPETIEIIKQKNKGYRHSLVIRKRMSELSKKRPPPVHTEQSRRRIAESLGGISRSEETCKKLRGSNNGYSKLKECDIPVILERRAKGETLAGIAMSYNVVYTTIQKVCSRTAWKHVEKPDWKCYNKP